MSDNQAAELLILAKSRDPADRERLLSAVANFGPTATNESRELVTAILMHLVAEAEQDIRRRLAEKLAGAAWAPAALINILALDEIEIARPILAASPVLQDHDLVRLLVEATVEHQIAIARRPRLSATVVEAILAGDEPAVLTALACNDTADVSVPGMERLVEASRRHAALRLPLTRHPKLSAQMAERLYIWVGQSLRAGLVSRFRIDPQALDLALSEAVAESHAEAPRADEAREVMEWRLIEKLDDAGQLKPGYLLRVLRDRQLPLFVAAIARLGGFDPAHIRAAIDSDRPELLALACAAVGIDRSVYPTILDAVRDLNAGRPGGGAEGARRAAGAFGPVPPDVAGQAFRRTVAAV